MKKKKLQEIVIDALDDLKGKSIEILNVQGLTSVTDTLIIASGTSNRHVKAMADNAVVKAKQAGHAPLGIEGEDVGEWVLVDFGELVLHVMLPATREFYDLERLWTVPAEIESKDKKY